MSDGTENKPGDGSGGQSNQSAQANIKALFDRFWRFSETYLPAPIDENSAEYKKRKHYKEEYKFIMEVAGFVVGIILAVIIAFQLWQMIAAVHATNEQTKETHRDFLIDERAWIGIFEVEIENGRNNLTNSDFKVQFKNTGRTPATDVAVWIDGETFLPKVWDITNNSPNWFRYTGMLAPDATGSINTSAHSIDERAVWEIENAGMPYYVSGKIWYRDIFQKTHWTEFCYLIVWNPNFSAVPVTTHNTCDDAQTNQPNQ